ncbi:GtrA family protein [Dehalobacter sp. DCM]|uniref:GtrA family protein n=1 Tax=Dehalobacter sp. DCM TaxID=2907827 RepID=UPI003081A526|nr:GtrA family protein [Dehalobacter sp. DCM]
MKYVVAGGIAFIADFSVLFVFHEYVLKDLAYSLYIATFLGFMAGLTVNYFLSLKFVFSAARNTSLGRGLKNQMIFTLIGVAGLAINELGMVIGVAILALDYKIIKVVVAGIVMVWNYGARKLFIFNRKYLAQHHVMVVSKETKNEEQGEW